MAYFVVLFLTPESDTWIPDYLAGVAPLMAKHGGKFHARTMSHERLEGTGPNPAVITIVEFPSKQAAEAFYHDPLYQPFLQSRLAGATNDLFLVEGKDDFAQS